MNETSKPVTGEASKASQPDARRRSRILVRLTATAALFFAGHYVFLSVYGDPFNLGSLLSAATAGLFGIATWRLQVRRKWSVPRWIARPAKYGLLGWAISFAAMSALIGWNGRAESTENVDAVIVLGGGIVRGKPSMALQNRLDRAADLLRRKKHLFAIVTGGNGGPQKLTEAEVMKTALVEAGIAPERIVEEPKASSTAENIAFSKAILTSLLSDRVQLSDTRVAIVTNDFHLFRAKLIAKSAGLNVVGVPASTPWSILPNVCFREYFAILKTVFVDL